MAKYEEINMVDTKKIAAIAAAVNAYLGEEVQTAALVRHRPAEGAVNLWSASGRMEIMQMSNLWQRRIVPQR